MASPTGQSSDVPAASAPLSRAFPSLAWFEQTGKAALLAGGCLYVIGLAISAFHLSRFGYLAFEFNRPRYVLVGVWGVLPLMLGGNLLACAAVMFSRVLTIEAADPRATRIRRCLRLVKLTGLAIASLGGGMMVSAIMTGFLTVGMVAINGRHFFDVDDLPVVVGAGAVFFAVLFGLVQAIRKLFAERRAFQILAMRHMAFGCEAAIALFASVAIGVVFLYLVTFTWLVYPHIPAEFGGGVFRVVTFTVRPTIQPGDANPIIRLANGRQSAQYLLIAETDKDYVIKELDDRKSSIVSATLSRDMVEGYATVAWMSPR